jgi:Domain of unknown function (DUF4388)
MIIPRKKEGPQLVADLGVFTAADALQWAQGSSLTGRLSFRADDARINLLFDRGGLVYAASLDRSAAFGRHLFSEGLVDEVDLAAAVVYSRDNQQRIGAVMVELGILDEATIKRELRQHTLSLAAIPLTWTEGSISAERRDSELMPEPAPDPVDATFLLMEAARRVDETQFIRSSLPHDDLALDLGRNRLPASASPRLRRLLETLTPGMTIDRLYGRIGGSHHLFLQSLRDMINGGFLAVADPLDSTVPEALQLTG